MSTPHLTSQEVPPLVVRRNEAEVLGTGPNTISLLADVPATGGALSATRTTLGEGQDGAAPHYHRTSAETFFILGGVLRVLVGEEIVTAREGDLVFVPPGTVHAFGAAPGSGADLLIAFTPGVERFGYFRLLGRIRDGDAAPDEVLDTQERYDNHFVDSTIWREVRQADRQEATHA
ncbi:cupin [Prauserella marina]|uniref:Cupin domain protein n=1 Tax=Prauserella marina TaxID=530584 RepID=A0A222VPD3_9PSEU|nr:cupin domain-containing protein [Prauserella marina]ASR35768.1 cupin [Prauserella marina]PWV84337.1 quercetin dioxygenase-like cupin family protein [Prauserella marina]SDC25008.1 Cupin domain protein [Prauserella marina]